MSPIIETEALLRAGRVADAWEFVEAQVATISIDREGFWFLHQATILANMYGVDQQLSWIDAFEDRARRAGTCTDCLTNALQAIRLAPLHNAGRIERGDRAQEHVDWNAIHGFPSVGVVRFRSLLYHGDHEGALRAGADAIESLAGPESAHSLDNDSRQVLEALVLTGFVLHGLATDRRSGDAQRLLEICESGDRFLLELFAIHVRTQLARQAIWAGRAEEAKSQLLVAIDRSGRANLPVRTVILEDLLAHSYAECGRSDLAKQVLEANPVPQFRSGSHTWINVANRLANQCLTWIQIGDLDAARRVNRRLQARLGAVESAQTKGAAKLCQATIAYESACLSNRPRRPSGLRRAIQLCEEAEAQLEKVELISTILRCAARNIRAKSLIALGQIGTALGVLAESLTAAKGVHAGDLASKALLIKSHALLEAPGELQESLYEEILRDLGHVHNPVVLFEVIANLYMHSWDLGDRVDLTAHHFDQLEQLRDVIEEEVFQRLYATHVVRRVAKRTLGKMFNCSPEDLVT